ncbi:histone H2B-like [Felis catus]|uniref:histone H2B-like n=1 Tax=Felis catus TaxID=9685 RepID=UPI000C2F9E49|nr:histone H2B-like [Felis catus]XP_044900140.1 histone H2B-like [Felis catus]
MPEEEDYTVYCSPSEVWEGQLSLWEEEEEEEEAYLGYVGKILKQTHPDFSGCSWISDALGSLEDWLLERVRLEVVRLSFYNHRKAITSREIPGAVKQRSSWKSFCIDEMF